jgi:hypothetical protein
MRLAGRVARTVEMSNSYKMLTGKLEGNRPIERRTRWKRNIKMNLSQIGWDILDWFRVDTVGWLL